MGKNLSVIIADPDKDFCSLLKEYLASAGGFSPIQVANDGETLIADAIASRPNVIICNATLSLVDGFSAMSDIFSVLYPRPVCFMLSSFSSEYAMETAASLGIDQFFLKPCRFSSLVEHILRRCAPASAVSSASYNSSPLSIAGVSGHAVKLLSRLHIPTHLNGYRYLKDAIVMGIIETQSSGITKSTYPSIGRVHNVSAQCVERSIRAAITTAWETDGVEVFSSALPALVPFKKPTNMQLISAARVAFFNSECSTNMERASL